MWTRAPYAAALVTLAVAGSLSPVTALAFPTLPIAQMPATSAGSFGTWLVNLAALVVLIGGIIFIWQALFPRQIPSLDAKFVTPEKLNEVKGELSNELSELQRTVEAIRTQIRIDYENVQRSGEARSSALHNRINEVLGGVAKTEGEVRSLSKQVEQLVNRAIGGGLHGS